MYILSKFSLFSEESLQEERTIQFVSHELMANNSQVGEQYQDVGSKNGNTMEDRNEQEKKEKRTRLKTNTAHERNNSECEDPYVLPLINDVNNSAQIERSIVMLETSAYCKVTH